MITDLEGNIEYVNPAFEKLTGYGRQEVVGKNASILKSEGQDTAFYQEMWRRISSGEVWRGHFTNQKKDGSLYEEEAVISAVNDLDGKAINYVAVKRDVTQEMAMEKQLLHAQKMEAVCNLASGVAYDFNNLLMIINNCALFVKDILPTDATSHGDIDQIIEAGNRATNLTRQLLAFSSRQKLKPQLHDMNKIVGNLEKMMRRLIRENIELEINLSEKASVVKVDIGQIE